MAELRRPQPPLRVVFAGPSIYGLKLDWTGIDLRRPAQQGDVEQAAADGAVAIGLVDGHYQQVGAVWHKEILLALSQGVRVFGAASMGALRAAECAAFGMIPVGSIAAGYCSGELFDDADVAVTNGPMELGYPPLTEPMVTVSATLRHLEARALLSPEEGRAVLDAAQSIYFADRTLEAIFEQAAEEGPSRQRLFSLYVQNRINPKGADARELVESIRNIDQRDAPPAWQLALSPFWKARDVRSDTVTPV